MPCTGGTWQLEAECLGPLLCSKWYDIVVIRRRLPATLVGASGRIVSEGVVDARVLLPCLSFALSTTSGRFVDESSTVRQRLASKVSTTYRLLIDASSTKCRQMINVDK